MNRPQHFEHDRHERDAAELRKWYREEFGRDAFLRMSQAYAAVLYEMRIQPPKKVKHDNVA